MGDSARLIIFAMGRRKIEMEYLVDDRVRKVTFCKRKGGLFKKADDLSKLCGVEIGVVIINDTKTCQFASTDLERILTKYRELNSGAPMSQESGTDRLWAQLESQRRDIEGLQRQLAEERKKVEALVGADVQICAVQPAPAIANMSGTPMMPISLVPTSSSALGPGSAANIATVQQGLVALPLQAANVAANAAHTVSASDISTDIVHEEQGDVEPSAKRVRVSE